MKTSTVRRLMKPWALLALFLSILAPAKAAVLSPRSVELPFQFESEFVTAREGSARELVLAQAMFLFAYLQNPEIGRQYGLRPAIEGIGAPRWEPKIELVEELPDNGLRRIHYRMSGQLLLLKEVAANLLQKGDWSVQLPYDLDHYADKNCFSEGEHADPDNFWYFGDPFQRGCEQLLRAPLARDVKISLYTPAQLPENTPVGLSELWGDNGNGSLFEITSINGFESSSSKRGDDGRVNYEAMNRWFRELGYTETVLSHFKNRPVHRFEKEVKRPNGSTLQVRITRLLVETDLDSGSNVTFAKFLQASLRNSDVVIYEGHSGAGATLDASTIEQRLLMSRDKKTGLRLEFQPSKRQIFFFDACSSFSYYLGLFEGQKNPGTLAVITNGLESLFGYELPVTKHLYGILTSGKGESISWLELLREMEKPLRGNTFLLNVNIN